MTNSERWNSISLNYFIWMNLIMTLPLSGEISLAAINIELGKIGTTQTSFNDVDVRNLLTKTVGAIAISDAYGKSNVPPEFTLTIGTDQANLNLAAYVASNGWNGRDAVVVTIAAGVFIYATTTANAGLTTGNFPGGLTIINNGYIIGMGGAGGSGGAGGAGGNALSIGCNCTIQNNGYIAGGGGGGGASWGAGILSGGGGGAGGGAGGAGGSIGGAAGGAPGKIGADGSGFVSYSYMYANGGGGGRILPGTGAAARGISTPSGSGGGGGGGAGGGGGYTCAYISFYAGGGAGGSSNNVGGNGTGSSGGCGAGGGGGWGSAGGTGYATGAVTGYPGGAGGKAVALNGFTVTWSITGNRYGAIA